MKMANFKNLATGLAESFEVGSRGDRKRRADPTHYTCLNPDVVTKPADPGGQGDSGGQMTDGKAKPGK